MCIHSVIFQVLKNLLRKKKKKKTKQQAKNKGGRKYLEWQDQKLTRTSNGANEVRGW